MRPRNRFAHGAVGVGFLLVAGYAGIFIAALATVPVSFIASLLPRLLGWPLSAVLLSLVLVGVYVGARRFLGRVDAIGDAPGDHHPLAGSRWRVALAGLGVAVLVGLGFLWLDVAALNLTAPAPLAVLATMPLLVASWVVASEVLLLCLDVPRPAILRVLRRVPEAAE